MATVARAKPDFGLDGPPVVAIFVGIGVVGVALLVVTAATGVSLAGPGWALVSIGLLTTGLMVHSSKRGKVLVQDKVLNQLGFRGSEDVLDLGCGSGLMLLGAATRAPQGTATGIDLWRLVDQVGSSRDSCMANARALGVADRVTLVDGDMSDLPFEDGTFDVVLACLAIHNIHDSGKRARTIAEATRVLRPGGRLTIIDLGKTAECDEAARKAGLVEVHRSGPSLLMYPPTRVVTARKPS